MDLIDWPQVARGALWIVGLSIALAAGSYTWWWASANNQRLADALARPSFVIPFSSGLLIFSASLAWGAERWWERALWAVLAVLFGCQMTAARRASGRGAPPPN